MDLIAKRILAAAALSTLAQFAALEGPPQSVVTWCEETDAPYLWVPGDVTAVDGVTSIAATGGTAGRWLLGSDRISIAPIGGGADDWPRLNTIMVACANKTTIGMRDGAWRCATQGDVPGRTYLDMDPGVDITNVLGFGNGVVFKATDTTAGAAVLAVTPTVGTNEFRSVTLLAVGQRVRIGGAGSANVHIGSRYQIVTVTPGAPNIYTVDRAIQFPFVANDPVRVITSEAAYITIEGNGATIRGFSDLNVQFQAYRSHVYNLRSVPTTDLSSFCYSIELSSLECTMEDCTATFDVAATPGKGYLLESSERSSFARNSVDFGTVGITAIDSYDCSIVDCDTSKQTSGGLLISAHPTQVGPGCRNLTVRGGGYHATANIGVQVQYATDTTLVGLACYFNIDGINIGAGADSINTRVVGCLTASSTNYGITVRTTAIGTRVSDWSSRGDGAGARIQNEVTFEGCDIVGAKNQANVPFGLFVESSCVAGALVSFVGGRIASVTPTTEMASIQGPAIVVFECVEFGCLRASNDQFAIRHYATAAPGVVILRDCQGVDGATNAGYTGAAGVTLRVEGRVDFDQFGAAAFTINAAGYWNRGQVVLTANNPVAVAFPDLKASDRVTLTRRVVAGGTGLAPVVVLTPGTGFTAVSILGDTDTYDYLVAS